MQVKEAITKYVTEDQPVMTEGVGLEADQRQRRSLPRVSVVMPVRNEASFIQRSVGAVLAQDYPQHLLEIFVVDGSSTDGTQRIVRSLIRKYSNVTLVDNPRRIVPTALNLALAKATGSVFVLVGGHCEIPANYVRRCVELLNSVHAHCVGGLLETIGETKKANYIARAQSSLFGVGFNPFRTGAKVSGYVDTVAFGAYLTSIFREIGPFDEELVRNQDDELNFRLLQAGGKIWLDPSLVIKYYSRANIKRLWSQYFQYGLYKVRLVQKRKGIPSWRALAPSLLVGMLLFGLSLTPLTDSMSLLIPAAYISAVAGVSLWVQRKDLHGWPTVFLAFLALHLGYGGGFLRGIFTFFRHWFHAGEELTRVRLHVETASDGVHG